MKLIFKNKTKQKKKKTVDKQKQMHKNCQDKDARLL